MLKRIGLTAAMLIGSFGAAMVPASAHGFSDGSRNNQARYNVETRYRNDDRDVRDRNRNAFTSDRHSNDRYSTDRYSNNRSVRDRNNRERSNDRDQYSRNNRWDRD